MTKKINYLWRLLATGFCYSVFGLGGIAFGALVFPAIMLLTCDEGMKRDRVRRFLSISFTAYFWMAHNLRVLRFNVVDKDLLKEDSSCLVIANHPSLIDVVALISLYPNACCVVKKELWNNFFLGKAVRIAGYIPNDDAENLLKNCAKSIGRGDVLIIFPEGTRTVPGKEMILRRGAAHIALRVKCPVRLIQIEVKPATLSKNLPWYRIPHRRMDFTVKVKNILDTQEYAQSDIPLSLSSRRLTRKMRENIDIGLTNPG